MNRHAWAALAAVTMLAGCGGGADPQQVVDTIRQTEMSQLDSIRSKDLVGIARLYADDAVLVRPDGTMVEGGAAIASAYGDLIEDPNFALEIEPHGGRGSTGDDLAVVTSDVDMTTTDATTGAPVTQQMISQTVWQRANGSSWKIVSAYNVPRGVAAEPAAEAAVALAPAETAATD